MKKRFVFLTLCFYTLAFTSPIQDRTIDPADLTELTQALNIPQNPNIIDAIQQTWLRKPHQERWEVTELSQDQRIFVLNWAKKQGFFTPWRPFYKCYEKALILGATTPTMQKRLDYLKLLWEEGVRFHEIVWLTGDRPLDERVDALTDRCSNESEAARILWQETNLPLEMKSLPIIFVAVPMKKEGGTLKRPDTKDTILAWLEIEPKPCTALFVSNQPFCGYQFAVIETNLPNAFLFDVVGPGMSPMHHTNSAAIILDSIARWVYQEDLKIKSVIKN